MFFMNIKELDDFSALVDSYLSILDDMFTEPRFSRIGMSSSFSVVFNVFRLKSTTLYLPNFPAL